MKHKMEIILTPEELNKRAMQSETIIMIDTLRASTTITTALANGAKAVIPFETQTQLVDFYQTNLDRNFLLAGESDGKAISSFDLDNSPLSFTADRVNDKEILLKTSNGTRALKKLKQKNKILIGALVNSLAICQRIVDLNQDLIIVCAGTKGAFSLEDFITAGRYTSLLQKKGWKGDDLVIAATRIFEDNSTFDELVNLFYQSCNGQNLLQIGYEEDIRYSCQLDLFSLVPNLAGDKIIL